MQADRFWWVFIFFTIPSLLSNLLVSFSVSLINDKSWELLVLLPYEKQIHTELVHAKIVSKWFIDVISFYWFIKRTSHYDLYNHLYRLSCNILSHVLLMMVRFNSFRMYIRHVKELIDLIYKEKQYKNTRLITNTSHICISQ